MGLLKTIRRGIATLLGARIKEDLLLDFDNDDERDHKFYRQLGRRGFRSAQRDLRPFQQDEQNRQAYKFYIENPFIRRIARMVAEFVVGNGTSVKSKDPQVQEEVDAWWFDPVNDFEKRHFTMALELPLYGELIPERVVNAFTGRHRYNWLDPLFIAKVNAHPKFPTVPGSIDFWQNRVGGAQVVPAGGGIIRAKILNGVPEEQMLSGVQGGEDHPMIFYFRTNNLSGALRGHSHYYPLFEWADVLDQAGFTMGERMVILLTYVWHLQADNMDAEQKQQWRERLENANPGSALLTGTNVKLTAVTPDLKGADYTETLRFLRGVVAGGAGVPEHFMGEGGEVNFATAGAMTLPTLRSFLQTQREYVCVIRTLARANLVSVAQRGRLNPEQVDDFTVQVDPMNPADTGTIATALTSLGTALAEGVAEGHITRKEAQQAFRNVLGGIVELDDEPEDPEAIARMDLSPEVSAAVERVRKMLDGDEPNAVLNPTNGNAGSPS